MLPTPNAHEPGWQNLTPVTKSGDSPTHPNERWYDQNTGRLLQKGLLQALAYLPTPTATDATAGTRDDPVQKGRGVKPNAPRYVPEDPPYDASSFLYRNRCRTIIGQNDTFKTTKNGTWRRHLQTGNNCSLSLGRYIQMLPTHKASDGYHPGVKTCKSGQTMYLSAAVMPLATPTASDWKTPRTPTNGGRSLNYEVQNLTTPTANDLSQPPSEQAITFPTAVTVKPKLNPEFVGAMMGFPPNWTQVEDPSQPMATKVVNGDSSQHQKTDYLMRHLELPEWLPRATDTDNIPYRRERLEALGNAVVPQQAAVAWKRLAQLIEWNLHADNAGS